MKKIGTILAGVSAPFVAFAADSPGAVSPIDSGSLNMSNVVEWIETVVGWLLLVAGILAIFFIILGGVLYIVSAGNEKRTETAKKMILYAVIGLAVILLAYVIYWFVTGSVTDLFS